MRERGGAMATTKRGTSKRAAMARALKIHGERAKAADSLRRLDDGSWVAVRLLWPPSDLGMRVPWVIAIGYRGWEWEYTGRDRSLSDYRTKEKAL